MSEKKRNSLFKEQKATKPKVEEIIPEWLDGDMKKNALDFSTWLRANKMSPLWSSANSWKANYKGRGICSIKILHSDRADDKNRKYSWFIAVYYSDREKYDAFVERKGLLTHFRENIWYCNCTLGGLPQNCGSMRDVIVLGKEHKDVCGHYYPMYFCDPDAKVIKGIKKLIVFEREARQSCIYARK